jgi:hypothetical protein
MRNARRVSVGKPEGKNHTVDEGIPLERNLQGGGWESGD